MNTAKELKKLEGFTGDARLFQVSPPIGYDYDYDYDTEQNQKSTEYVVVSATNAMFSGPETYIFPVGGIVQRRVGPSSSAGWGWL